MFLFTASASATVYPDEQWAPDNGAVFINDAYSSRYGSYVVIDSYISWNTLDDLTYLHDDETETFELDVVMYEGGYADRYLGTWDTSLPAGYLDSAFLDDTPTFSIGSTQPWNIEHDKIYYLSIDARRNTENTSSPFSVNSQRGYCLWILWCDPNTTIYAYQSSIHISRNDGYEAPGWAEWGEII